MAKQDENPSPEQVEIKGVSSGATETTRSRKEALMMMKLTSLQHDALLDAMQLDISGCEDVTAADNPVRKITKSKLELDISTVAKREYAKFITCGLDAMAGEGDDWSKTKWRRDACTQLAVEINDAVDAVQGVEHRESEAVPLTNLAARHSHTNTELVVGGRYLLPDALDERQHLTLIFKDFAEGQYTFSNMDGEGEYSYFAEDLTGLVGLPEAGDELNVAVTAHDPQGGITAATEATSAGSYPVTPVAPEPAPPADVRDPITPVASDEVMTFSASPVTLAAADEIVTSAVPATGDVVTIPQTASESHGQEPPDDRIDIPAELSKLDGCEHPGNEVNEAVPHVTGCDELPSEVRHHGTPVAGDEVMTSVAQHPETGTAVMVREIETYLTDYIQMDAIYPLPLALWVCFTHCWESSPVAPQVMITAATSLSGKTALLETLSYASDRPYLRTRCTKAALYRQITTEHPTIFKDEAEELNRESCDFRDILNGGYRQGQMASIVIGNREVDFENYCPKAFALIGDLFSSFRTRCMIIELRRREGTPTRKRYNPLIKERGNELGKRVHDMIVPLREKYEGMIRESLEQPDVYNFLGDRDREIFEPLFVLCQLLCPERLPELERCAASIAANQSHELRKINLIAEARVAAEAAAERAIKDTELIMRSYPRMGTYDLIIALRKLPTGGWDNYKRPGGITPDASGGMLLHELLKRFGLQSGTVRLAPASAGDKEDTKQGFKYEDVLAVMEQHGIEPYKSSPHHPTTLEPAASESVPSPDTLRRTPPSAPSRDGAPNVTADIAVTTAPTTETAQITGTPAATPRTKAQVKVHRVYAKTKTHFRVRVPGGYLNYEFVTMTEDSDSVDSIWVGDFIGVERVNAIDGRGLRTRRIRKLPGAICSPVTPKPTENPDEPFNNPRTSHCYAIRLANREEDLLDAGLTAQEAATIKVQDLTFGYVNKSETSMCKRIVQFVKRHEWLGSMPLHPTHRFVAEYNGQLAGVVVFATPNAFSKLLGEGTNQVERIVSRGACVSWSPRNTASAMLMFSINWMVQNTRYRMFVCYADEEAQEIGQIYQACNFLYLGQSSGTHKMYFDPQRPERGYFSDRIFRSRSAYRRYAGALGIKWQHEWQSGEKIFWDNIPEDIASKLREFSRAEQTRCEYRILPRKHKYAMILGKDRRETKALMHKFTQLNPKLVGLPYPKRVNLIPEETEIVTRPQAVIDCGFSGHDAVVGEDLFGIPDRLSAE